MILFKEDLYREEVRKAVLEHGGYGAINEFLQWKAIFSIVSKIVLGVCTFLFLIPSSSMWTRRNVNEVVE